MIALSAMIRLDEDALICDIAETYNVINFRELSPLKVAILACGLRVNSRIRSKMAGLKIPIDLLMNANVVDRLSLLVWAQTEDGQKGKNRPKSFSEILLEIDRTENNNYRTFKSGEDFEVERQKLLRKE